tara:strand:- start:1787 stop:2185 length:399 start_codon:yes stop_codon:yes gene_type:complete
MKKTDLKNIIKECVREVILEEGMLSGIVSEVVHGLGNPIIQERQQTQRQQTAQAPSQRAVTKKKVLEAMGANSYDNLKNKFKNPELFEGTQPIQEGNGKGALSGVASSDPGVDITNIPGFGSWSNVASATRK